MKNALSTAARGTLLFTFSPVAPVALATVAMLSGALAAAQTSSVAAVGGSLAPVTVTGNPLGTNDLVAPATAYSGTGLLLRASRPHASAPHWPGPRAPGVCAWA